MHNAHKEGALIGNFSEYCTLHSLHYQTWSTCLVCPGDWPEPGPAGGVGVMVCLPRSSPPPTAQSYHGQSRPLPLATPTTAIETCNWTHL